MLEKMGQFFDARLNEYDKHQMTCIENAQEIYSFTAKCLPLDSGAHILDLGCGTGLELEHYFTFNPYAKVTGIDLAPGMLNKLKNKLSGKNITLILGSYFDVTFGSETYNAAVSVESLHHFTKDEKIPLYSKLLKSLKTNGYFILTDYFSTTDEEEKQRRRELLQIKETQCLADNEFYHYDTPLTVKNEIEALHQAGFSSVEILKQWGVTCTLKATKHQLT